MTLGQTVREEDLQDVFRTGSVAHVEKRVKDKIPEFANDDIHVEATSIGVQGIMGKISSLALSDVVGRRYEG